MRHSKDAARRLAENARRGSERICRQASPGGSPQARAWLIAKPIWVDLEKKQSMPVGSTDFSRSRIK